MKKYEAIFQKNAGVARIGDLQAAGLTYYSLRNLLEKGVVTRIKQGVYRLENVESEMDEMLEAASLVPHGVFCLFSACAHFGLTTFVSGAHHLAIPKKSKVVLPAYPPVQLYYWAGISYTLGTTTVDVRGGKVKMYDMEKTVCDMVKFRNKVGIDSMKEVLHNYLRSKDRKIHLLNDYAREMNIAGVLSKYLDVLL